jgi:hypothetical protein
MASPGEGFAVALKGTVAPYSRYDQSWIPDDVVNVN